MKDKVLEIYRKLRCSFFCPHELNVKKAIKKIEMLQADKHQLEIILQDTEKQLQDCQNELVE